MCGRPRAVVNGLAVCHGARTFHHRASQARPLRTALSDTLHPCWLPKAEPRGVIAGITSSLVHVIIVVPERYLGNRGLGAPLCGTEGCLAHKGKLYCSRRTNVESASDEMETK